MTDFDPSKALREEISGLIDIRATLLKRERDIEMRFGELEVELNMLKKLRGFADVELSLKRTTLQQSEDKTPV